MASEIYTSTVLTENKSVGEIKILGQDVRPIQFAGCLPGDAYAKIPVTIGQRAYVSARIAAACDSSGWRYSPHGAIGYFGPEGNPANVPVSGEVASLGNPIAMLVGAVSAYNHTGDLTKNTWLRIFGGRGLPLGREYFFPIPTTGFLYLIMNDGWGEMDNGGSMGVSVCLF